jgi:PST family polysaccharide transporter
MASSNVLWSVLEAAASALLSFVSAFCVARLVGPAEVGIGAAAVSVHVLLWVAVNALFADALVQRSEVDAAMQGSAFCASAAVGLAGALAQAALGPLLVWSIGDPRLTSMSLVLALPLPLVGAAGAVQGMLTRGRNYRRLARRTLVGQGLGTLTGIATAAAGGGAWALVLQQLVVSGAGALSLLAGADLRPALAWQPRVLRALLAIGLPLTASTLVQHARYRVFALAIGATAGPAVLGQVHMAFRLVDTVRDLAITALWRLMLPAMSECQYDLSALRARLRRVLVLSGLTCCPRSRLCWYAFGR